MNSIILIGNITAEPELIFTSTGIAVAKFTIAVTKAKDKTSGEWISDFFNCTVWGNLAENAAASLERGSRVILAGKLITEKWIANTGNKKQAVKIKVEALGPELSFARCKIDKNAKGKDQELENENEDIPF